MRVWDAKSGGVPARAEGAYLHRVLSVSFSGDGSRIAQLLLVTTLCVSGTRSPAESLLELKGHSKPDRSVSFSGDGSRIASGSDDRTVRVWDAKKAAKPCWC